MKDRQWKDFSQWDRGALKKNGKLAVVQNYTAVLLVSVIYILFGIGYGSSTINVVDTSGSGHSGQIFLDVLAYKEVFHNLFCEGGFALVNIWNQFLSYSSPLTDGMKHVWSAVTAKDMPTMLISLLAFLLVCMFTFFVKNILIVGDRRFFLENQLYQKTQMSRMLFVYRRRALKKVAWAMFVESVFQILWSLTIVGGLIKFYSYRLVPYILAENPSLGALEAITLSRQMMNGNKWRWFLLDITFLPWRFLSGITFQLAGLLYVYGFIRSTESYLYAQLRQKAIAYQMIGSENLNDSQLYEKKDVPQDYYPDYASSMSKEHFAAYYGRHYTVLHLVMLFFVFSCFGWLWEVSLTLIRDGVFVNRGFMHGPWLPIYGSGGTLILILLKNFRKSVFLTFASTVLLCGVLEYTTSWVMEITQGKRWWDYSGYLFNLNGRVCLEVLLIFAVGGCALVYLIAPKVDDLLQKIPAKGKVPIAVILLMLFSYDAYYTHAHPNQGQGITSECQIVVSATGTAAAPATTSCGSV